MLVINYERDRIGRLRENRSRHGDVVRLGPRTIAVREASTA